MKRFSIYLFFLAALTFGLSCCSDDSPEYRFPDRPAEPEKPEEPEEHESDYPKGMSVEAFETTLHDGKITKGYIVTVDFAANPKLQFNPIHLQPARKPTAAFDYFKSLGRGTPYVATNAGYFYNGASLSLCITDGEVQSIASQTAYPKDANGQQVTAYPVRAALGQMTDGTFEATWVYCVQDDGRRPYSFPSPLDNDESTYTYMAAPPTSQTEGARLWEPRQAIGGGPMLVYDGENVAMKYYYREVLDAGGTSGSYRVPRTAIGATKDGTKLMLVVCDGRNSNGSAGLTIAELADVFIGKGMDCAINLDGGGSSEIVGFDGSILNVPSDGIERSVPTAIVISEKE